MKKKGNGNEVKGQGKLNKKLTKFKIRKERKCIPGEVHEKENETYRKRVK